MSLARKGARRITVDGIEYFWKVSVDSGFFTIVVQLSSGAGQRLEAQTAYERHFGDKRPITPGGVAALVREALSDGWEPEALRPPHRMDNVDERVSLDGNEAV